ncbi:hypothetical protein [uncultured Sphingomonas sp.]|uniref:hypothetical protein n=1 Tax=uncultured Sphingomonas sp. TaxID=158754 RepID=UPI0025F9D66E|nr:hypothetical protein [uncultured Sphingomonas sp.]
MQTFLFRVSCLSICLALPAYAQTAGGNATGGSGGGGATPGFTITPPPSIQPATGSSQVRQAPANSAMRRGSGGGTGSSMAANPMGMAGMSGAGATGTNALTLGSGMSGQSSMGQGSASGTASGQQGGGSRAESGGTGASRGQQGGTVRITDTGVTQRTPNSPSRPR